jgi:hypothetical protein
MANDSSLLPTTGAPPGQASYYTAETVTTIPDAGGTVTGKGIAFDYSDHLDRVVTALEQLSLSMAFVADKIENLSDNSTLIKDSLSTIATQTTTLASNSTTITGLATGPGIHIVGAYDVFQMVSIYRLLIEQAQILENAGTPAAQITAAQAEVTRVSQLIKSNIPRDF